MVRKIRRLLSILLVCTLLIGSMNMPQIAFAAESVDHLVISQVYGGGGNKGAPYNSDFVELYNPTDQTVDLKDWSVQYASKTGSTWKMATLSGSLAPSHYYLIKLNGGSNGVDLPDADASGSISMNSGSGGKVALASKSDAITGQDDKAVVDFVGYGSANESEGSPIKGMSATKSVQRLTGVDTDNNSSDFTSASPNPRSGIDPNASKVAIPEANIGSGYVLSGSAITFKTVTDGAFIEYNTKASDHITWTSGSAITVSKDVNVYARGVKTGMTTSDVAKFEYDVIETDPITLSQVKELSDGTDGILTKGIITHIDYKRVYVQDDTGAVMLYMNAANDKLKVGQEMLIIGERDSYNGLIELTNVDENRMKEVSENNTVNPVIYTLDALKAPVDGKVDGYDTMCEKVLVQNATLVDESTLQQGETSITINPKIKLSDYSGIALGDQVDVTAVVGYSNSPRLVVKEMIKAGTANILTLSANPSDTSLVSGSTVTLSANHSDAKIYYTTDGSVPTSTSTLYSDPITITGAIGSTVTVKAFAEKSGLDDTEVLSFTYTIKEEDPLTPAEAKALKNGTTNVRVTGIVTYIKGKDVYIQDSKAAIALRLKADASQLKIGDEVVATGTRGYFNGIIQITGVDEAAMLPVVSEDNARPDIGKVSIAEILEIPEGKTPGYNHMCEILELKGLLITDSKTLTQGEASIGTYPSMDLESKGLKAGDFADVRVRVNAFGEKVQVEVLKIEEGKDPDAPVTLKEALELKSGTEVVVKGQIVYFATGYGNPILQAEIDGKMYALYVFGAAPEGAKIGDIVKIKGTYKVHFGLPELTNTKDSQILGHETPIPPQEMTFEEIKANGPNLLGQFVKIKDVTLGEYDAGGSTQFTDSTGSLSSYKAPAYPALIEKGDVVDLYAMISCFQKNETSKMTIQLNLGTKKDNGFNVYDVVNDTKAPLVTLNDTYLDAKAAKDYVLTVGAADNKDIKSVIAEYTIGDTVKNAEMLFDNTLGLYKLIIPAAEVVSTAKSIKVTFTATDVTGLTTLGKTTIAIDNRPQISEVSPPNNSNIGLGTSPKIKVSVDNAGTDPSVKLTMKKDNVAIFTDAVMTAKEANVLYEYATSSLEDGVYTLTVVVTRQSDGVSNEKQWLFTVGEQQFKPYFGQLHAHTAEYSDGAGTLANALSYFKNTSSNDNVDFISMTDHSNFFDTKNDSNPAGALNDKSLMTADSLSKWNAYNKKIDDFNTENSGTAQGLAGFEMTWSGGPGHINTFNSDGLISRNNSTLNNKTDDQGLKAYYETLIENTDSLANLSQFNHPSKTFGTFSDFAYWTPAYDNKMVAIEVGNGEGAVGSGGYFGSYTEYTKALDKGWHVAPTNNQDNHKGKWGNSNTARTVIITDQLTETGLLTGLKNMSVYATEDNNLDIQFNVNNQRMGTIISDIPTQPLEVLVRINDPDNDDVISKVDIISNGGRVVKSKTFSSNSVDWTFELPSQQGYYYVRVAQADKQMAVTAPVWIGQAPLVGISSFETSTKLPVTDEALSFEATLFNNESEAVTLKTIEYKVGNEVLETEAVNQVIDSAGTFKHQISYTPTDSKEMTISVKAIVEVAGQDKSFDKKVDLYVRDAEKLTFVGIDASHYNEYVNGNYKDSMGNFANMAVKSDVRVVELDTSEAFLKAMQDPRYKMLILTPPTRRNGKEFLVDYASYSDEEIEAIKAFVKKGNTVIVTGWADKYEGYSKFTGGTPHQLPADQQMSVQQNKLLEAMGSTLRISDDGVKDHKNNEGQSQRLYLTEYNLSNDFVKNVNPKEQVYSNYGGATIYGVDSEGMPSDALSDTVSPMVYSFETSVSEDDDKDGTTGIEGVTVPRYNNKYMVAASEKVTYANGNEGTIVVAGAAFMSNFEIQAKLDSYATPEYSNYTILDALVKYVNEVEVTSIDKVHKAEEGVRFTIEGIVTSNASGFDKSTAFFDCIYLQDGTAGINAFPVSGDVRAGQTVRLKGVTSSYNGERQLSVSSIEIIDDTIKKLPDPIKLTTVQASKASNLGSLVKVSGLITKIEKSNDVVETIMIKDASGKECRVFIDGYITKDKTISNLQVGNKLTAVGLSSISTEGPRVRVRDRDDLSVTVTTTSRDDDDDDKTSRSSNTGTKAEPQKSKDQIKKENADKAKASREALKEFKADKKSAVEATKSVIEAAKQIASGLKDSNMSKKEMAKLASELDKTMQALVEKPDLTGEEASEVATAMIKDTLGSALKADKSPENAAELNKQAEKIAKKAIKQNGKLKLQSAQNIVTKDELKETLQASIETFTKLRKDLVEGGLTKAASKLKPVINVSVPEGSEEGAQRIAFDQSSLDALIESNADVEIEMGDLSFNMPADMLASFQDDNVVIENGTLSNEEVKELGVAQTESGVGANIVSEVFEIEFQSSGKDIEIGSEKPELTIDVSNMVSLLKTQAHLLSVFVYDEETKVWEHVPSKIVDGVAVFEAPHFSKYAVLKANVKFDDVDGHWAQETIEMMSANEITAGRTDTSFKPDENITRAEFASYLVNMMGLEGTVSGNFKDVDADAWYYDAVGLAAINGLVSGVGEGNFAPDATITRQDMAVMMSKAYKLQNDEKMQGTADAFVDNIIISEYAKEAVYAARYHEIVGGFADGSFRPKETATRAQAAQMLRSFWEQN